MKIGGDLKKQGSINLPDNEVPSTSQYNAPKCNKFNMPCIILQDPENHDKKNSDIAPDSEWESKFKFKFKLNKLINKMFTILLLLHEQFKMTCLVYIFFLIN